MILLIHIIAALGSLVAAGALYFSPSVKKMHITYFLTASMFTSGTYLVIRNSSHLLEACVMGLTLLAVVSFSIVSARHKLTQLAVKAND